MLQACREQSVGAGEPRPAAADGLGGVDAEQGEAGEGEAIGGNETCVEGEGAGAEGRPGEGREGETHPGAAQSVVSQEEARQ